MGAIEDVSTLGYGHAYIVPATHMLSLLRVVALRASHHLRDRLAFPHQNPSDARCSVQSENVAWPYAEGEGIAQHHLTI